MVKVKVKNDKRGSYVRYKGKKIRLPKTVAKSSEKNLLKWLIEKIISLFERKKRKPKKAAETTKKHIDPNIELIKKRGDENAKQTEDKGGMQSYINSLRKQQELPAIQFVNVPPPKQDTLTNPAVSSKELMPHPGDANIPVSREFARSVARHLKNMQDKTEELSSALEEEKGKSKTDLDSLYKTEKKAIENELYKKYT